MHAHSCGHHSLTLSHSFCLWLCRVYSDAGLTPIAGFYLDVYSRPATKRGGAWMDEAVSRSTLVNGVRLPIAYLICNQAPPSPASSSGPLSATSDPSPSLLRFEDVVSDTASVIRVQSPAYGDGGLSLCQVWVAGCSKYCLVVLRV